MDNHHKSFSYHHYSMIINFGNIVSVLEIHFVLGELQSFDYNLAKLKNIDLFVPKKAAETPHPEILIIIDSKRHQHCYDWKTWVRGQWFSSKPVSNASVKFNCTKAAIFVLEVNKMQKILLRPISCSARKCSNYSESLTFLARHSSTVSFKLLPTVCNFSNGERWWVNSHHTTNFEQFFYRGIYK